MWCDQNTTMLLNQRNESIRLQNEGHLTYEDRLEVRMAEIRTREATLNSMETRSKKLIAEA